MRSSAIKALLEQVMSGSGLKAYPVSIPSGQRTPAMAYSRVGGSSEPTFETSGMQKLRLQVDIFAPSALIADDLREELVQGLNGFTGLAIDGTELQNVQFMGSIDFFENFVQDFRCGAEFMCWFVFP